MKIDYIHIFLFSSTSLINQLNNILKYTILVFLAWLAGEQETVTSGVSGHSFPNLATRTSL